jgi:hypothetical protein
MGIEKLAADRVTIEKPTEENPSIVSVTDKETTTAPAETNPKGPEIAKAAIKSQSRDKEITALLKIANPNIELNDETKPIIQNIRRQPDALIKKMASVVGMDLGTRQKSTGAFKRSGVAESMDLNEAAIDDYLIKLGVTDETIKANKDAIASVCGLVGQLSEE